MNPKTGRMVLRSGRIGKAILKKETEVVPEVPELPEDVVRMIFEKSSLFDISKVSKEWHSMQATRMEKAKEWFKWILVYLTCTDYFVDLSFVLLGGNGVKLEISIELDIRYFFFFSFTSGFFE